MRTANTLPVLVLMLAPVVGANDWESPSVAAKSFVVEDLQGRTLRSEDLAGRIVIVDFWATWCAPCVQELPDLAEYYETLEGREDVVFLSFNVMDERAKLQAFVKDKDVPFPVFRADDLVEPFELAAFPTKLVIDMREAGEGEAGIIRFRKEGLTTVSSIEARVEELLASGP